MFCKTLQKAEKDASIKRKSRDQSFSTRYGTNTSLSQTHISLDFRRSSLWIPKLLQWHSGSLTCNTLFYLWKTSRSFQGFQWDMSLLFVSINILEYPRTRDVQPMVIRPLHLLAFSLWIYRYHCLSLLRFELQSRDLSRIIKRPLTSRHYKLQNLTELRRISKIDLTIFQIELQKSTLEKL